MYLLADGTSAEELPTDSEGEGESENGQVRKAGGAGKMSKSRATGLAKVSLVIEWLASALGSAGASASAGCVELTD